MTKKEFRKKNKKEKTNIYKLMMTGSIISVVALILLIPAFLVKSFNIQIGVFTVALIIALIGMIIDLIGEYKLSKNYKEYLKNTKN